MIKKHYKIITSILLNILLMVGMGIFVGYYYELSDDWFMARSIVNGNCNYTFCSFFIQFLTSLIQKLIYPLNAYIILQIFFCFVSLVTVCYIFLDTFGFRKGILFSLLVECTLSVNFYSIITFTKTAAILVVAGGLMILWAFHCNKHPGYSAFGIALVLLGSFYRMKIFYAVFAIFCFCILSIILWKTADLGLKNFGVVLKEMIAPKLILPVAIALILVFACNFSSNAILSSEDMTYYKEYNHLRSTVVDYPLPSYEEAEEEFKSIGISENDYKMLTKWYFDDQGYADTETLQQIISIQDAENYTKGAIIQALKSMVSYETTQIKKLSAEGTVVLVYLVIAITMIILYQNRSWIFVGSISVGVGVLLSYLWIEGRTKYRAVIALWIAAIICLLYTIRFLKLRKWVEKILHRFPKTVSFCTTLILLVVCCILLIHTSTTTPKEHRIVHYTDYPELYEYICENEDKTFALSYTAYKFIRNATVLRDPLYIGLDDVFDKCIYFGTPYYAHPNYNQMLSTYGIDCLYTDLINSDDIYFVDRKNSDIEMLVTYLSEQYTQYGSISYELITVLDEHYIYKIFSE